MYGLVLLIPITLYALLLIWCIGSGVTSVRISKENPTRLDLIKGGVLGLTLGLLPFWDNIAGQAILEAACHLDPPITVIHERSSEWKARHENELTSIQTKNWPLQSHPIPNEKRNWYLVMNINKIVQLERRSTGIGPLPPWPIVRSEERIVDQREGRTLASRHNYSMNSTLWKIASNQVLGIRNSSSCTNNSSQKLKERGLLNADHNIDLYISDLMD